MSSPLSRILLCIASALLVCTLGGRGSSGEEEAGKSSGEESAAARGAYLVQRVAMCGQCHTPRDDQGRLLSGRELQGAPVPVASPFPNQEWAVRAPSLTSVASIWKPEELAKFLETGRPPQGAPPRPPMPPYRFNREDARAIAEYLRSL